MVSNDTSWTWWIIPKFFKEAILAPSNKSKLNLKNMRRRTRNSCLWLGLWTYKLVPLPGSQAMKSSQILKSKIKFISLKVQLGPSIGPACHVQWCVVQRRIYGDTLLMNNCSSFRSRFLKWFLASNLCVVVWFVTYCRNENAVIEALIFWFNMNAVA